MLATLQIHNFALLEDVRVDFTAGFNVFTGETGAGKSILVDAFGVVLGGRASADYVRQGTDGFWVQAVFDDVNNKQINSVLSEQGIEEDDQLFIRRIVNQQGKSKSFINGVQVPLGLLKEIGALLVDIHGQNENQQLLKSGAALLLTDEFAGKDLAKTMDEYMSVYEKYRLACKELDSLCEMGKDRDALADLYRHTVEEIADADLKFGEEEELSVEADLLRNGEKIAKAVNDVYGMLDSDGGVLSLLADARTRLGNVCGFDERLQKLYEAVDSAWIGLDDIRCQTGNYIGDFSFDDERVNKVQSRLDLLYHLQKKYGGTVEDIIAKGNEAKEKLAALENLEKALSEARGKVDSVTLLLSDASKKLTCVRQKTAKKLVEKITEHIHDLAMPDGQVKFVFGQKEQFTDRGRDEIEFLFSANKGEPLCELAKVASGGELSRLALAVKTVLLSAQVTGCMVFDEIDTGVGGITAEKMAEKIAILSGVSQVLCITHLPQIAAFADRHIFIQKSLKGGRTVTGLTVLNDNGRIDELVRMAAGSNKSAATLQAAQEMLKNAFDFKKKLGRKGEKRTNVKKIS